MPATLQRVEQQAAASSAAAADNASRQIANAVGQATREGRGIEQVAAQIPTAEPTAKTLRVLTDALEEESQARGQLAWQVQGLTAALEYLRSVHQAGHHPGAPGMTLGDAARLLGALNEEAVRRIVEFLREAANTRRQADDRVDPGVSAQMWTVLQSIQGNLQRIETSSNSASIRQYVHQMLAEARNVDYQALLRKHLSHIGQRPLDQYPDPGMPVIEEQGQGSILDAPGKGVGAVGKVIKHSLKDKPKGKGVETKAVKDAATGSSSSSVLQLTSRTGMPITRPRADVGG